MLRGSSAHYCDELLLIGNTTTCGQPPVLNAHAHSPIHNLAFGEFHTCFQANATDIDQYSSILTAWFYQNECMF